MLLRTPGSENWSFHAPKRKRVVPRKPNLTREASGHSSQMFPFQENSAFPAGVYAQSGTDFGLARVGSNQLPGPFIRPKGHLCLGHLSEGNWSM